MAGVWDEILTLGLPNAKQDLLVTCPQCSVCNFIILHVVTLHVFQEIVTDCEKNNFSAPP